jgi:hypothetical protein
MRRSQRWVCNAYAIFIDTFCEGLIPAWHDDSDMPIAYATELEAKREIAQFQIDLLQSFLDGRREFEDATTIEDVILPVYRWPDGSFSLEDGRRFGKRC